MIVLHAARSSGLLPTLSMGITPDANKRALPYRCGMKASLLKKIDNRLEALGLSDIQASVKAGLGRDTIRDLRRGKRETISVDRVAKLAAALECSATWLIGEDDSPRDVEDSGGIGYGGVVEAGAFRRVNVFDQTGGGRRVPIPPDPRFSANMQAAFEVVGDSMNEAKIFPGMWVHAVELSAWEKRFGDVRDGKLVVVAKTLKDADQRELTVKRLRLFRDRMELHPESTNKEHQPMTYSFTDANPDIAIDIVGVVLSAVWIYE